MSWFFDYGPLNRGKVGELNVKTTSHWERIEREYWSSTCDLEIYNRWDDRGVCLWEISQAMVRVQHALVDAADCEDDEVLDKVVLIGELYSEYYKGRCVKEHYRCPYHEDLLPNWGKCILLLLCYLALNSIASLSSK